jgi:NADH-quinone oxidoreductase subunit C
MREELEPLLGEFPDAVQSVPDLRGGIAFRVEPAALKPFVTRLKERGFDYLSVVTAVDNHLEEPRFETVYVLRSIARNVDLRINVPLPGEEPTVDSLSGLYPAANWMEREVWDLFGIRFEGHPNLERILMWEGFEGHPLRKEYPLLGNSPGTPGYTGKGGKR